MKLKLMGFMVVAVVVFAAMADVAKVGDYVYRYSVTSNGCIEIVDEQAVKRLLNGQEKIMPRAVDPRPVGRYEVPNEIQGLKVSSIGVGAFMFCGIKDLFIPKSVMRIGECAFYGCSKLSHVRVEGCEEICEGAFQYCSALEDLDLSGAAEHLKLSRTAISSCEKLRRIRLPLDYCDFMPFRWALNSNAVDQVIYTMARDASDESLMGAFIYFCWCYQDDMLTNWKMAEKIAEVKLNAMKRFVRRHPDRYLTEIDHPIYMLGNGPLVGVRALYVHSRDKNFLGPMCQMEDPVADLERKRQKLWEGLDEKDQFAINCSAYACLQKICDMLLTAYDEPSAGECVIEISLRDDDKIKKVDLYKRMARHEAKRVLMWRSDPTEEYHPKVAREKMLEYVQEIMNLGFVTQAQMLQVELEGLLQKKDAVAKANAVKTGTGWFVDASYVATCWHVVQNAKAISIEQKNGQRFNAKVVANDPANDIVILKIDNAKCASALPIRTKGVKIADKVFTVGYPLSSLLGQTQKYSEGVVSSTTGLSNDSRYYQISVPIQPGNSGGPLMDEKGCVIGLTSSALDALKLVVTTGTIPQNVNYAIKVRYLAAILDDMGIDYATATEVNGKDGIVERVAEATVLVIAE